MEGGAKGAGSFLGGRKGFSMGKLCSPEQQGRDKDGGAGGAFGGEQ